MRPANYVKVEREQIMKFLARAINRGGAEGLDRDNGFRITKADLTDDKQAVRVDLENTDFFFIDIEHLVPRSGDF